MKQSQSDHISESIWVILLTVVMTFMEMSALPAALFCNLRILDVDPVCITLMVNFLLAFAICFLCKKTVLQNWHFGLQAKGLRDGLSRYGAPAVVATAIVTISFCIGLAPFDNKPTVLRIIIEGIVYYIGVGIMEELYLRGLLQNKIEKWFGERKNAALNAILITSVLFGLGHIFGALGQPVATVVCKTIWATALGVFLSAVYVRTRNLWVPIVLHTLVDLCGIPFCFSTSREYPAIALVTTLAAFVALGIYGIWIIVNGEKVE